MLLKTHSLFHFFSFFDLNFCRLKLKRSDLFKECFRDFALYSTCLVQFVAALVKGSMIWLSGSTEKQSQLFCHLMYKFFHHQTYLGMILLKMSLPIVFLPCLLNICLCASLFRPFIVNLILKFTRRMICCSFHIPVFCCR